MRFGIDPPGNASRRYGDARDMFRYSFVRNPNAVTLSLRYESSCTSCGRPGHMTLSQDPWDQTRSVHSRVVLDAPHGARAWLPSDEFHLTSVTIGMYSSFSLTRVPTQLCSSAYRSGMVGNVPPSAWCLRVGTFALGSRAIRRRTPIVGDTA